MVRVMMLAPFLLGLSAYLARSEKTANPAASNGAGRIAIPWFASGFVALCGVNSLSLLPPTLVAHAVDFDTALLTMAMAALGLSTHLSALRRAGVKPLLLASVLFIWLIAGGAMINWQVLAWFG